MGLKQLLMRLWLAFPEDGSGQCWRHWIRDACLVQNRPMVMIEGDRRLFDHSEM